MVANRGEIATRIFRAIHELKMTAIAIYAKEDEYSEHRFKADEAYLVGEGKKPIAGLIWILKILFELQRTIRLMRSILVMDFYQKMHNLRNDVLRKISHLSVLKLSTWKCLGTK
jgi:hypothetical protein